MVTSSQPRHPRTAARAFAWAFVVFVVPLSVSAGCRAVISLEEREYEPATTTTTTTTTESKPELTLDCPTYCEVIMKNCVGPKKQQYKSQKACLGLCRSFPVGRMGETGVPTLGCRMGILQGMGESIEEDECSEAGPSGYNLCGNICAAYCASVQVICREKINELHPVWDCMQECDSLVKCSPFWAPDGTPNDQTIQCRLYHLVSASENFLDPPPQPGDPETSMHHHCPHALGVDKCDASSPPGCSY